MSNRNRAFEKAIEYFESSRRVPFLVTLLELAEQKYRGFDFSEDFSTYLEGEDEALEERLFQWVVDAVDVCDRSASSVAVMEQGCGGLR